MIHEYIAGDLTIYNQIIREVKDDYTARKVIKDRRKLRIWLINLLNDRSVMIFYKDQQEEKFIFLTGKKPEIKVNPWEDPYVIEEPSIPDGENKNLYITGYEINSNKPIVILLDSITKFVVKSGDLITLSNSIYWYDEIYD